MTLAKHKPELQLRIDTHTLPSWASYRVSIMNILKKIYLGYNGTTLFWTRKACTWIACPCATCHECEPIGPVISNKGFRVGMGSIIKWLNSRLHIEGFVQGRHNSIANALGLRRSCTNPSIYSLSGIVLLHKSQPFICYKILTTHTPSLTCEGKKYVVSFVGSSLQTFLCY